MFLKKEDLHIVFDFKLFKIRIKTKECKKRKEYAKKHLSGHFMTGLRKLPVDKLKKVSIKPFTYGPLNVRMWDDGEGLEIGSFCSIAEDVLFLCGGHHNYKTLSTYPLVTAFENKENTSNKHGKIVVKDDVWVGTGATILNGVTIGQGAIVGARSVVTKDIPPYSIVAGNPAKVIKYRFEKEIIEKLLSFADYSKINIEKTKENRYLISQENITKENIDEFRKFFDK